MMNLTVWTWWRGGGGDDEWAVAAAELPVTAARDLDRVGVYRWGAWQRGEPCTACRRPPPLFIVLRDRGSPTIMGWAPPIRAQIIGPGGPLGPLGGDQPNRGFNHFTADCPKEDKKEDKEESTYKRKPCDNKGKPHKPEGQKGVEAHLHVSTRVESAIERCGGGGLGPLGRPVNEVPENSASKLPRKPAALPAQQHYCLSGRLVEE